MVDAKNLARELHRKFTKVARARQAEGQPSPITVQIPLPHNAPQVWSGSSLDPKGLVGELKMQWGESDNTAALRGALFAGSLDALMRLEKEAPKTETLVRYHDSAAGLDRLESMTDFLGLPNAQATPAASCQVSDLLVDQMTQEFLRDCYDHTCNYRLPTWRSPQHEPNTVGVARALAWLHKPPEIEILKDTGIDTHEFPMKTGTPIKLVESKAERARLKAARGKEKTGKGGTGVNEYSPFVWCNLSVDEIASHNFTALGFINQHAQQYSADDGSLKLRMHALDHVGIKWLIKKAEARGVIGPLRLSANALIADPTAGSVVVQRSEERRVGKECA